MILGVPYREGWGGRGVPTDEKKISEGFSFQKKLAPYGGQGAQGSEPFDGQAVPRCRPDAGAGEVIRALSTGRQEHLFTPRFNSLFAT